MRSLLKCSSAVVLSLGCATSDPDPGPTLLVGMDAGDVIDAFQFEPDPDGGLADPDEGPQPDPDAAVVPLLEGAAATITIVEQPQVDVAEISVAVTAYQEPMPGGGSCQVVRVNPNDPPAPVPALAAGPITVEGLDGGPYTFTLQGGSYRANRGFPSDVFGDRAPIRATAGGALPFDIQITAPDEVSVSSPFTFGSLDTGSGSTIRWNAAGGDAVLITVFPTNVSFQPTTGNWIFCGGPDNGSFNLAAADLQQVGAGRQALVAVTRTRSRTQLIGSSRVILTATTSFGVPVTLE